MGVNYRIPKTIKDPESLTLEACQEIIAKENERKAEKEPATAEAAAKGGRKKKK